MLPTLSVRIAELPRRKDRTSVSLERLAALARAAGFCGLSLRPSMVSIHSSAQEVDATRATMEAEGLSVSMVTGDLSLVTNDAHAPAAIRCIGPHLDLAARLGAPMVRVMMHDETDIPFARRAADAAAVRGISLSHQCHWGSLCETIDDGLDLVAAVARPNFGITLEPANLLACGGGFAQADLCRLAPSLFNVYFQNMRLDSSSELVFPSRRQGEVGVRYAPLGDRTAIDAAAMLATLRTAGYDGWFTVHQPGLEGESVEDAIDAAAGLIRDLGLV